MAVLASDNFNRANETPLGAPWTVAGSFGALQLASNVVRGNLTDLAMYYSGVSFPDNQWAQLTATNGAAGAATGGPAVRMSGANFYIGVIDNAGAAQIQKCVAGSFSTIATTSRAFSAGDVAYIEAVGSQITLKINGVTVHSVTDTSLTSGSAGMYFFGCEGIDDWSAGDFVSSGPTRYDYGTAGSVGKGRRSGSRWFGGI